MRVKCSYSGRHIGLPLLYTMKEHLVGFLLSAAPMKKELIVFLLAMAPISELRGAIPVGVLNFGLPFWKVWLIAVIGNFVPCIPLYFLLNRILRFLEKSRFGKKFSDWLIRSTKKRSRVIEVYETIGLIVFVGIPLPITGAWTGTMASALFRLKFRDFLIGVICGILLASFVVSLLTLGINCIR